MRLPDALARKLRAGTHEVFVAHLTTSLVDGHVNILSSPFTDVVDDELVLIPDLFAQKTKVNLNENRSAAMSFSAEDGSAEWVLEGSADVVHWGHPPNFKLFGLRAADVLDRWGDWDESVEPVIDAADESVRPSVFAQRGVIVFRPERVSEAGK